MSEDEKTDGYFVVTMLAIGLLGLVVFYQARIISIVWEKADHNAAKVEILMIDSGYDADQFEHNH